MESSPNSSRNHPRPWLSLYSNPELNDHFAPRFENALAVFRDAVVRFPECPAIHYFDITITYSELDKLSTAFAGFLVARGINPGDRVALYLQNVPQFVIGLVGIWKAGAIGVSINPMNRSRELKALLADCGARVLVAHRDLYVEVVRDVLRDFPQVLPVTTSVRDFQARDDARVMPGLDSSEAVACADTVDMVAALKEYEMASMAEREIQPESPAMIVYTSGTTGIPKGALITHGNFATDIDLWRAWAGLEDRKAVLAVAPLFHITGLVGHVGVSFGTGSPLILSMRFHPEVMAESAQEYQADFVVGAITALIALMNSSAVRVEQLRTLTKVYSGGAPIPATVAAEFTRKFGKAIRNVYGLTETTALAIGVPRHLATPTDDHGAFSIGVPVYGTDVYIADEDGMPVPLGTVGEIFIRGPQVVPGYWQRDAETAEAFFDGYLRTGDVGYMSDEGWIYIVDRKKDMISASGYKVWPREVEDVIYGHPAVREVVVVGVQDEYRGETVKAVVSLRAGHTLEPPELIAFCKERMAAYKYPRIVEIRDELPKTTTGKLLRRSFK